jgi:hypothetical protein
MSKAPLDFAANGSHYSLERQAPSRTLSAQNPWQQGENQHAPAPGTVLCDFHIAALSDYLDSSRFEAVLERELADRKPLETLAGMLGLPEAVLATRRPSPQYSIRELSCVGMTFLPMRGRAVRMGYTARYWRGGVLVS